MKIKLLNHDNKFQNFCSENDIRKIVDKEFQFIGQPTYIVELSGGLFNRTFEVSFGDIDTQWILRIAPPNSSKVFYNERDLLKRESKIEQKLSQLSKTFPRSLKYSFDQKTVAFSYAIHAKIEGQNWHEIYDKLTVNDNLDIWKELGEISKSIHTLEGDFFGFPEPFPKYKTWHDFVYETCQKMLSNYQDISGDKDLEEVWIFLEILANSKSILNEINTPFLCHGDLWQKNILVSPRNKRYQLSALLDCERGFYGDPFSEWVFHYITIPNEFWEAYGKLKFSANEKIRNNIYKGMYAIQFLLESTRFGSNGRNEKSTIREIISNI